MSNLIELDTKTRRDLQLKQLEILKVVDKICKKNNIEYFLAYGTLLGAIRHQGFIPWDDDLDIFMTFDNYNKFVKVCENDLSKERYFLQNLETEKNYYLSFSKVRDLNTTLVETFNETLDINKNVYIDIFPLVGYPNKKYQRVLFKISRAFMHSVNINIINSKFLYFIFRIVVKIFGKKRILKMSTRYCTKFHPNKCDYLCSVCDGDGIESNLYKSEWYSKIKYVKFEDIKAPVPYNYDEVLKKTYNDYMKLPPIELRSKGHCIIELNLEKNVLKESSENKL